MDSINLFYTTYESRDLKNEFEIPHLGVQKWQGDLFAFSNGKGKIRSFGGGMYDVKQEHYDYEFYLMLMEINPPYRLTEALDYHYNNYKIQLVKKDDFINHIEYVIFPLVLKSNRTEHNELIKNWVAKNKQIMLDKHLEEKVSFLNKAYEVAIENCPQSPLSYKMGSVEIGKSIGLDENSIMRIMQELVSDGYAETGARYIFVILTNRGLSFLRSYLSSSQNQNLASINLTVGNNATFQIQNATHNSHQTINNNSTKEQLLRFIEEFRIGKEILKQNMKAEDLEELQIEVDYLERSVKSRKPNTTKVHEVIKTIRSILENVTANVIASVFTNGLPK
jgi:hypothetical protein